MRHPRWRLTFLLRITVVASLTNVLVCVSKKFMSRMSVLVEMSVHARRNPHLLFNN